jgi:hypothetical protein
MLEMAVKSIALFSLSLEQEGQANYVRKISCCRIVTGAGLTKYWIDDYYPGWTKGCGSNNATA